MRVKSALAVIIVAVKLNTYSILSKTSLTIHRISDLIMQIFNVVKRFFPSEFKLTGSAFSGKIQDTVIEGFHDLFL